MNDIHSSAHTNTLLSSLSSDDLDRLAPLFEQVEMPHGQILYSPNEPISHVYFPDTAMASIVAYSEEGQGSEVAVVGNEGATGLPVVMGADSSPYEHMVQIPGQGRRIKTEDVRAQFDGNKHFREAMLSFTQKMIVQVSQNSFCNRMHSVEQRLSRWLLMCHDRAGKDSLPLTQEFLGIMLGASRPSVTLTAIELQKNGFISYSRGNITMRNRPGLEEFSCGCYEVIRKAYYPDSE